MTTKKVAGVWHRVFEQSPLGTADGTGMDRDTLVLWTQAPASGIYVDLRLPFQSPGRNDYYKSISNEKDASLFVPRSSALAARGYSHEHKTKILASKTSPNLLDVLLDQQSFAGVLDCQPGDTTKTKEALQKDFVLKEIVESNSCKTNEDSVGLCTCFWRRDIDCQPDSTRLDIGVCASQAPFMDGSLLMRETGDDASYAEGWHRLAGTNEGPFMALELVREDGIARTGYWVRAANRFAYAVGYPASQEAAKALWIPPEASKIKSFVGQTLKQAMEKMDLMGDKEKVLDIAGSYLALAGEITDQGEWIIRNSTNPEILGCHLVQTGDGLTSLFCSTMNYDGDNNNLVQQLIPNEDTCSTIKREWKIVEIAGCGLPIKPSPKEKTTVYGMDAHPDFAKIAMPRAFDLPSFTLDRLSPKNVDEDFAAVTFSASSLNGLFGNEWPEGLTKEENHLDLAWHEREFTLQRSFSWIVRNMESGEYIGCAYLFPDQGRRGAAKVVTWIRSQTNQATQLEKLNQELKTWLENKLVDADIVLCW